LTERRISSGYTFVAHVTRAGVGRRNLSGDCRPAHEARLVSAGVRLAELVLVERADAQKQVELVA
jgi:hypothetical protein